MKLLIRDAHARMNNEFATTEMPSGGLEIVNDDDRALYRIHLQQDGSIQIYAGDFCGYNGRLLTDTLIVRPLATNTVYVDRPEYKTSIETSTTP